MMQGIVTDENGAYVKAAIVKLYTVKDPDDESGAGTVTYAETGEDGNFIIQGLDPDEKYSIEIYVEHPETRIQTDAAEVKQETETEALREPEALPMEDLRPETEPEAVLDAKAEPVPEPPAEAEADVAEAEAGAYEPYFEDDPDSDYDYAGEPFTDEYSEAEFLRDITVGNFENSQTIGYTVTENISVKNLYITSSFNLKDKPYLMKNNLW